MSINAFKNQHSLNSFQLKTIALLSMFFDHFATIFLSPLLYQASLRGTGFIAEHSMLFESLYNGMRWFGRLAFPLYCFLLVEGFRHTRNRSKYALRLLLFALLSEIPFDMAFSKCVLELRYNNVFFTLLMAFLMIWIISWFDHLLEKHLINRSKGLKRLLYFIGIAVVYRIFAYLTTFVLWSDYDSTGLLMVLIIYLFKERKILGQTIACCLLTILSLALHQLFGLLTVPLIAMYNEQKGPSMKYAFYVFYPLHLLVLAALVFLLGIGELQGILI